MVKERVRKTELVVYHDDYNSMDFVTEILMQIVGLELTQAGNCAFIIANKGEYVVRTFSGSQRSYAKMILEALDNQGIPAELIEI